MNSACVLVVEDEDLMRQALRLALQSQGYAVVEAESGTQALAKIRRAPPDIVLLDLGLPDRDGVEVTTEIRRDHDLPIIVVSARSEEQQQICALDAGANDYVTKPFREGELLARVRASLRHAHPKPRTSEIVVGDIGIDIGQRRVVVAGREISLTATEFQLLSVLANEAGRVVTHKKLLREVWGEGHEHDVQYLRVYVKQIREKIGDSATRPKRILTALGVGYRLV